MMRVVPINKSSEDITIEEAKQFECCKDMTDEQIAELLESIRTFTEITFHIFAKCIDNQCDDIKPSEADIVYKAAS